MYPTLDPANLQSMGDLLAEDERSGFISDMIDTFVISTEARLRALRTAVETGDVTTCRAIAHQQQSSSGAVGAIQLSQLWVELEAIACAGVPDRISAYVAQIEAEYDRVVQALERERDQEADEVVRG